MREHRVDCRSPGRLSCPKQVRSLEEELGVQSPLLTRPILRCLGRLEAFGGKIVSNSLPAEASEEPALPF